MIAPDGGLVGYASQRELRVQPALDGGWDVATLARRWRRDYYLAPDGMLMAVSMTWRDGRPQPSVPVALFKSGLVPTYNLDHYAVAPSSVLDSPAACPMSCTARIFG